MAIEQILKDCTVDGNVVKLPPQQLERDVYLDVKKKLELIGGKWKGGRVSGFVFQQDPTELLQQIANGDTRNLKKEYQYFATPDAIADHLVELAAIEPHHGVLEPSAGQGAIIKAIHRQHPGLVVDCFELMDLNYGILKKMQQVVPLGQDFLLYDGFFSHDRIVANPPFSKNQDIEHIMKMYDVLRAGGRLVSCSSKHWEFAQGKKEDAFRTWLDDRNAQIEVIPSGSFKESGTTIEALIIIIDKP